MRATLILVVAALGVAGCDAARSKGASASKAEGVASAKTETAVAESGAIAGRPAVPSAAINVPRPPERVALRFLGALLGAKVDAPRLHAAVRELAGRGSMGRDPLSRLPAALAPLARKVTFPSAREKGQWEMRESLFAPPPFRASFEVVVPKNARLSFELPRSPGVTYAVELARAKDALGVQKPRRVFQRSGGGGGRGPWSPHAVDLSAHAGQTLAISFVTEGRGPAFFATPRLFARHPHAGPGAEEDAAPPSVLLIAIDTLTAEAVGSAGGRKGLSPNMDDLGARGAVFTQAFTNGNWTRASTVSMFGSEYSSTMGLNVHSWWLDREKRRQNYVRHRAMLPELLKRAGYQTAAIVNNLFVLGYHSAGVEVGFEEVTDFRTDHRDTPDVTEATLAYLEKNKDRPFFLFMNLNTPHHPYTPPARYLAGIERPGERLHPEHKRYLGEVKFADDYVGRVLRALEKHGIARRTLVILTADHGEGLRADLAYTNVAIGRFSRFTHTVNMYDEVTRVPLSFTRPADLPAGRVVTEQVRLIDVAPTVLGLVGLSPHPQHKGVDLSAALRGEARFPADLALFAEGKKITSVRAGGFKYIRREAGFERIQRQRDGVTRRVPEELYEVARDPRELRDLTASRPDVLKVMRQRHSAFVAEMGKGVVPSRQNIVASASQPVGGRGVAPPPLAAIASKGTARTHLVVASDRALRIVRGAVRAKNGRIVRYRLMGTGVDDALWPTAPDRVDFSLRAEGGEDHLYVETSPHDAELEIEVRDGDRPLDRGALLLGPFGLPLAERRFVFTAQAQARLLWSAQPPPRRKNVFGVFLWREGDLGLVGGVRDVSDAEPAAEGSPAEGGSGLEKDVEDALRGWGYIQKGDKVLK